MRLVAVLLVALAFPAAAAADVRHVDASRYPEIGVTVVGSPARAPALREDGHRVAGLVAENLGRAKSVVLAVDRSRSMEGAALANAVFAARAFVLAKSANDRIAIVAFGSRAVQLTRFSSATIDADIALRDLGVDAREGTALNDAVALGARMLRAEAQAGRVLVVVTDGRDISSSASARAAVDAARKAGAAVYAVGIESDQFSPAALRELATSTGGTYRSAVSSGDLLAAYAEISRELARTWRLTYVTAARPGERIEIRAGGGAAQLRIPGAPTASAPRAEPSSLLPEPAYHSSWGSLGVGLAVGILLLLGLGLIAGARRASWLKARLMPHVADARRGRASPERERFAAGSALLRATERAFGQLNWWTKATRLLERADVPLRTVEFLYIALGSSLGVALLAAVSGASSLLVLLGLAGGGAMPVGYVKFRARKRLRAFENQLPDLLLTLAASLKAGHSFKQGLQTVVDEGQPPASKELTRVLAETRLGRPMDDALNEMADRVSSKNLRFVINAVTIQGQVGGSLAGLFDMVAETVRQRQQFTRKIRGLTAMGRASAYVLVALPFFTAALLFLLNREFMEPLYGTSTGQKLLLVGLGMMGVGSLFLKRIVSFRG
jgi:tight adherence protein B